MPSDPSENLGSPADLGAERDRQRLPIQHMTPWAEGDEPHGESIDPNEYPARLLHFKICRSFRADLLHKLTIIVRAHGGSGRGGIKRAAARLRVSLTTFADWFRWRTIPFRWRLEQIDTLYAESIALLVAAKTPKKKRKKKK